jgi:hypothetical protein
VVDLLVEQQAGIPFLMQPLRGDRSDPCDFAPFMAAPIAQRREAQGLESLVADRALDPAETLQRFGNPVKWISRVPETSQEATDAISQGNLDPMTRLHDDYHSQMRPSPSAQGPQRWMLGYSEPARQRGPPIIKRMLTQGEQAMGAFQNRGRQELACAPDAAQALAAFQKTANGSTVGAGTSRPLPRSPSPGRPGKARKPDLRGCQLAGRLRVSVKTYRERLQPQSWFIVAPKEVDETRLSNEDL